MNDTSPEELLRKLISQRLNAAGELARDLGLPTEDKYQLLALFGGVADTVGAQNAVNDAAHQQGNEESAASSIRATVREALDWSIDRLFPTRRSLSPSTMGRSTVPGGAGRVEEHQNKVLGVRAIARKIDRPGGTSSVVEIELTRADGEPLGGVTLQLSPKIGGRQEQVTDARGMARFTGLANVDAEAWHLQIGKPGGD